ncbi:MAG TPA: SAM-dependent methyltransferase [Kofleriaceae bacterium]|jgi:methyltransferase (TIGR00027 family)
MRENTPSRTAQWVAAARGMGMLLPADVRIADDPYGVEFTSHRLATLVRRREARALAYLPGISHWVAYMQVRTRVLDDYIRDFVSHGGAQVVLLGAGFDCRALRLHELAGATVFEVDHPATQHHKRAVLERAGAHSPAQYLAWNFEENPLDDLPGALATAGLDRAAPTITIWEGVTMYLTEPAIDASLRAIAAWSAPRSRLAMTYASRSADGGQSAATRVIAAAAARLGEPWRWSWVPAELPAYLATRGWGLREDLSTAEAARDLLPEDLAKTITRAESRMAVSERLTVSDRG